MTRLLKGKKTTMNTRIAKDALADAARKAGVNGLSADSAAEFRELFRQQVRAMLLGVMEEEVNVLCGAMYHPAPVTEHYRAGSAPGYVLHEGRRIDVVRPRVRRRKDGGGTVETPLATYANAQEPGELQERILEAFHVGVSSRDQRRLHGDGTPGVSKSEVSRLWRREGEKALTTFRARDIARDDWLVLMLDGVWLDKNLLAVVALGVAADGTKHLLDFEFGASESTETAKGLLERISRRGFKPTADGRLLAVLDGSSALKSAVLAYWPDTVIQRCLVHKMRNLQRFLRKGDWKALKRLFDRLRKAQGLVAGKEALREIERFVGERNKAGLESLREAGDELLAVHGLEVPSTLHISLLSTNLIECPFRNVRRKLERVSRWDASTDQPSRWLAYGLMEAERGFRRVRHAGDLGALRTALRRDGVEACAGG